MSAKEKADEGKVLRKGLRKVGEGAEEGLGKVAKEEADEYMGRG
jgi:hypothetical protein